MKIFLYLTFFAMIFLMTIQISGDTADRKLQNSGVVSLSASETKEVNPDFAKINFIVENTATNMEKAKINNTEISLKIANVLQKDIKIAKENIKTSALAIYPVNSKTGKKYQAKTTITVETKDLNNVSKIIEVATNSGIIKATNVVYSIQNEKEACKDIYPEIINELKNQANDVAQINDQYVIGVKNIDLTCKTNTYSSAKNTLIKDTITNAIRETESIATEAGKIKVTATVDAKYTISR